MLLGWYELFIFRFLLFSRFLLFTLLSHYSIFFDIHGVITCPGVNLDLNFFSLFFFCIVLYFSFTVFKFSAYYIEGDIYEGRFYWIFFIFVGAIILFVSRPDIFFLIFGWEILGVRSYLLVRHYQRSYSLYRSRLTILVNRLGDRCLIFRICSLCPFFLLSSIENVGYVCLFLILSSFSKSAQLPFSVWLPAAMAAPTPVSSLVHSSTLVTAGVYLFMECYFYFSSYLRLVVLIIRLCTMLFSSLRACFELNAKKIIALSTTSQISVIFFMLRLNYVNFAFFHLVVHAGFKSTLFIAIGIGLHSFYGQLDSRVLAYSWMRSPFLVCLIVLCNLCLIGFPFSSAFYSKDGGFEFRVGSYNIYSLVVRLLLFSIFLSCFYRFKVILNFLPNFLSSRLIRGPAVSSFLIKILGPMLLFIIFFGYVYSRVMLNAPFHIRLDLFFKTFILLIVLLPFIIRRNYFRKFFSGYIILSLNLKNPPFLATYYRLAKFCLSSRFYIRDKVGIFISFVNSYIYSLKLLDFGLINNFAGTGKISIVASYLNKLMNINIGLITSLIFFLFYILGSI